MAEPLSMLLDELLKPSVIVPWVPDALMGFVEQSVEADPLSVLLDDPLECSVFVSWVSGALTDFQASFD